MRFILPVLALAALPALAQEQPVPLRPGNGLDKVQAGCGGCHSLDYIRINAPFITLDTWKAEMVKMRTAFGAPIEDADAEAILKYLAVNYGPPAL